MNDTPDRRDERDFLDKVTEASKERAERDLREQLVRTAFAQLAFEQSLTVAVEQDGLPRVPAPFADAAALRAWHALRDLGPLGLTSYQMAATSTAVYPGKGTGSPLALAYVGLGLGEAGEVQGKLKKVIRDDGGVLSDEKRAAIAAELGDLLWYIAAIASELKYDLEDIAQANLDKLSDRRNRGVISGSGDNR